MSDRTFLEEIRIKNIGVITDANLELSKGLTVLTGETGAGKTMVLTALNLVLGGKSDSSLVRTGEERMSASATFSIPKSQLSAIEEQGVEVENNELILGRTVGVDGKSKALASGVNVPAATLANLAASLIEIHGQSANANIAKSARQRELLDRFAGDGLAKTLAQYQSILASYQEVKARIKSMKEKASARDAEIATIKEFAESYGKLKPQLDEFAAIESEIKRLSSVETLRVAAATASSVLDDEEAGAINSLGQARKALDQVKALDPELEKISDSIGEAFFLLADIAPILSSYLSSLEADPARLEFLQERKAALTAFVKKWESALTSDEALAALIARGDSSRQALADLEGGDNKIAELEKELNGLKSELLKSAKALTSARTSAAKKLGDLVTTEIQQLSMPHTTFIASIESINYEGALKESDFTQSGCDEVSMLLQGHKDGPLVPLAKGASGGEMSRVMLALEVVLAATHPVGTYIFDEVDAGVGGKAAIEVGRRLSALAKHAQVIVVTHLPQVAAWGDSHFVVVKSSDGTITASGVTEVTGDARKTEIARMLAGIESSTSALEHAAELLALK